MSDFAQIKEKAMLYNMPEANLKKIASKEKITKFTKVIPIIFKIAITVIISLLFIEDAAEFWANFDSKIKYPLLIAIVCELITNGIPLISPRNKTEGFLLSGSLIVFIILTTFVYINGVATNGEIKSNNISQSKELIDKKKNDIKDLKELISEQDKLIKFYKKKNHTVSLALTIKSKNGYVKELIKKQDSLDALVSNQLNKDIISSESVEQSTLIFILIKIALQFVNIAFAYSAGKDIKELSLS